MPGQRNTGKLVFVAIVITKVLDCLNAVELQDTLALDRPVLVNADCTTSINNDRIAEALCSVLARLDPAALQSTLKESLVPHLLNDVGPSRLNILDVLRIRAHTLSSEQILPFARELAAQGRINYLKQVVDAVPALRWYVRHIGDDSTPKRIVYGVCERDSPELLFDPELQAPPPESIKALCGSPRLPTTTNWLQITDVRIAIEKAFRDAGQDTVANAFIKYVAHRQHTNKAASTDHRQT